MRKEIFLVAVLVISLSSQGYAQLNQQKEEKKAYIDIGGTTAPAEGKQLTEEEVEKVREEMKVIQNTIQTSVSARNAQNAVNAAKSATAAQSTMNSVKQIQNNS